MVSVPEDSAHRYLSEPISTSIGCTCPWLAPSGSTALRRVQDVPFGMLGENAKGDICPNASGVIVSPLARRWSIMLDLCSVFPTSAALDNRLRHVALFMISAGSAVWNAP
jgi:hypothetical protein